jgi:hypothetical protein
MPEGRGDEAVASHLLDACVPPAGPHDVALGPLERSLDRVIVRIAYLLGRVRIAESEEHGHGLRCPEREVEARHSMGLAEPCPSRRVKAQQDGVEVVGLHLAVRPSTPLPAIHCPGASPPT